MRQVRKFALGEFVQTLLGPKTRSSLEETHVSIHDELMTTTKIILLNALLLLTSSTAFCEPWPVLCNFQSINQSGAPYYLAKIRTDHPSEQESWTKGETVVLSTPGAKTNECVTARLDSDSSVSLDFHHWGDKLLKIKASPPAGLCTPEILGASDRRNDDHIFPGSYSAYYHHEEGYEGGVLTAIYLPVEGSKALDPTEVCVSIQAKLNGDHVSVMGGPL